MAETLNDFNNIQLQSQLFNLNNEWITDARTIMSCRTSQATTTCIFSSVTVTTFINKQYCETLRTNSVRDLLKKKRSSSNIKKKEMAPLSHPKFMSPLMNGHVSGLKETRSSNLAKIRKNRFFHDILIAERDIFMEALHKLNKQRRLTESSASRKIQKAWRAYNESHIKKHHQKSISDMYGFDESGIRGHLIEYLAEDSRCVEWAFSLDQRIHMDLETQRNTQTVFNGAHKSRKQRLKASKSRKNEVTENRMLMTSTSCSSIEASSSFDGGKMRPRATSGPPGANNFAKSMDYAGTSSSSSSSLRQQLAHRLAIKKLEESEEMIEARRLEAESDRKRKVKKKLVSEMTGVFSNQLVMRNITVLTDNSKDTNTDDDE
mmetsp:Transcript_17623/g.20776  ORF Transcript_17623/g.20776 Transcript_17623/m.20776 type:complete len:376 (+) Transcript_17623:104-1231(+)